MKYLLLLSFCFLWSHDSMDRENLRIRQDLHVSNDFLYHESRNEQELIDFIESVMETGNIPGLSIAVIEGDNIVWNKTFGIANVEQDIPVSDSTMFMLASVSKTVTGTALMQLWEDGMIDLDRNINDYLPFNVVHPDYPNISITTKMLLSHTSGIRDNWSVMDYYEGDPTIALGDYLQNYLVSGGDFYNPNSNFTNQQPGTNFSYSNIGAALIGYLVESISMQPFNEYCNEHIFEPLDMDSRWFLSELNINNIAMPHRIAGGVGDNCYDIGCGIFDGSNPCQCDNACLEYGDCCDDYEEVCGEDGSGSGDVNFEAIGHYGYADYPSGQLRTSASDLAKFAILYTNAGVYNNIRILDSETIEFIKTIPYPNIDYLQAIMWYYKNQGGRTLFGHNGGDLGVSADMFISLSNGVGVIVIVNCANYSSMIEIEEAIFDFVDEYDFQLTGDMNSDMAINVVDVILLLNLILENGYSNIGDLNSDGSLNIQDIVLMIELILER